MLKKSRPDTLTNKTESKERGVRGCWRGVTGCNRVRELDNLLGQTQTNTVYNIPTHLMEGVEGKEMKKRWRELSKRRQRRFSVGRAVPASLFAVMIFFLFNKNTIGDGGSTAL